MVGLPILAACWSRDVGAVHCPATTAGVSGDDPALAAAEGAVAFVPCAGLADARPGPAWWCCSVKPPAIPAARRTARLSATGSPRDPRFLPCLGAAVSELEGRGAAWAEGRGTGDEGRR